MHVPTRTLLLNEDNMSAEMGFLIHNPPSLAFLASIAVLYWRIIHKKARNKEKQKVVEQKTNGILSKTIQKKEASKYDNLRVG